MIWGNKIKILDMVSMHLQKVKLTLSIIIWRLICVHNLKSHSRVFLYLASKKSGIHDIYVWMSNSIRKDIKSLLKLLFMPPVLLREFNNYCCIMNTTLDKCFFPKTPSGYF